MCDIGTPNRCVEPESNLIFLEEEGKNPAVTAVLEAADKVFVKRGRGCIVGLGAHINLKESELKSNWLNSRWRFQR